MKSTAVVYVDVRGAEHDALVRAVNNFHEGYVDLVYVDGDAPEGDNVKTVFSVPHMDDESKKEPNPALPQIHLNVWKEHYRVHSEPASDHPIFDSPYEEKQKDEFGKPLEKARPEWEAQIAAHQESIEGLPSAADLDSAANAEERILDDKGQRTYFLMHPDAAKDLAATTPTPELMLTVKVEPPSDAEPTT